MRKSYSKVSTLGMAAALILFIGAPKSISAHPAQQDSTSQADEQLNVEHEDLIGDQAEVADLSHEAELKEGVEMEAEAPELDGAFHESTTDTDRVQDQVEDQIQDAGTK
ncbi:MAG TPA: hypothetical protein VOA64_21280 [Candidatus Dormibacteraeota bacterium]|nr:hypothetical protein [Candidatus Dormibacteraeota bacterium]